MQNREIGSEVKGMSTGLIDRGTENVRRDLFESSPKDIEEGLIHIGRGYCQRGLGLMLEATGEKRGNCHKICR